MMMTGEVMDQKTLALMRDNHLNESAILLQPSTNK